MTGAASLWASRFSSSAVLNPLTSDLNRMGVSPSFDKSKFVLLEYRSYAGKTLFIYLVRATILLPD